MRAIVQTAPWQHMTLASAALPACLRACGKVRHGQCSARAQRGRPLLPARGEYP